VRAGAGLSSLWDQLHGQIFLGGEGFLKRMQKLADQAAIGEIPRAQRRALTKPLSHYRKLPDAKQAMVVAYATVSRAVKQCEGNL